MRGKGAQPRLASPYNSEDDVENIAISKVKERESTKNMNPSQSEEVLHEVTELLKRMKPSEKQKIHVNNISSSSDDDERESIRQQRAAYKSFLSGDLPSLPALPQLQRAPVARDDVDKCPQFGSTLKNQTIPVSIQDFSFSTSFITAQVGDILTFALSSETPGLAEHLLQGDSSVLELCFQSPILSVEGSRSFSFCLRKPGELTVCCLVYPDMCVHVKVLSPGGSPDRQSRTGGDLHHTRTADAYASSTSSFYDSDDVLEDEDPEYLEDFDELSDTESSIGKIHKVWVSEFSFNPSKVFCKVGDAIVFELFGGISSEGIALECAREFGPKEFSPINTQQGTSLVCRHVFRNDGVFEVRHAGKTYVACHVVVTSLENKSAFHVPICSGRWAPDPEDNYMDVDEGDQEDYDDEEEEEEEERRMSLELRAAVRSQSASVSPTDKSKEPNSRTPLLQADSSHDRSRPLALYGSFITAATNTKPYHEQFTDLAMEVDSDDHGDCHGDEAPGQSRKSSISKTAKKRRNQRKKKKSEGKEEGTKSQPIVTSFGGESELHRDRGPVALQEETHHTSSDPAEVEASPANDVNDGVTPLGEEPKHAIPETQPEYLNSVPLLAHSIPGSLPQSFFEGMDDATLQAILREDWAADLREAYGLRDTTSEFVPVIKKKSKMPEKEKSTGKNKGGKQKSRAETKLAEAVPPMLVKEPETICKFLFEQKDSNVAAVPEKIEVVATMGQVETVPSKPTSSNPPSCPASSPAPPPAPALVSVPILVPAPSTSPSIPFASSIPSHIAMDCCSTEVPYDDSDSADSLSLPKLELVNPLNRSPAAAITVEESYLRLYYDGMAPPPPQIAPVGATDNTLGSSREGSPQMVMRPPVVSPSRVLPVNSPSPLASDEKRKTLLSVLGLRPVAPSTVSHASKDWSLAGESNMDDNLLERYFKETISPSPGISDEEGEEGGQNHAAADNAEEFVYEASELEPNEQFFIERFDHIIALVESGSVDRLPSGKKAQIYVLSLDDKDAAGKSMAGAIDGQEDATDDAIVCSVASFNKPCSKLKKKAAKPQYPLKQSKSLPPSTASDIPGQQYSELERKPSKKIAVPQHTEGKPPRSPPASRGKANSRARKPVAM